MGQTDVLTSPYVRYMLNETYQIAHWIWKIVTVMGLKASEQKQHENYVFDENE